jgi:chitosanase
MLWCYAEPRVDCDHPITQTEGIIHHADPDSKADRAIDRQSFETGVVLGDYGSVTVIPGDTGHLTFGRSQTTLGSGNLLDLLQRYCGNHGARFGHRLERWLPRFEASDVALDSELRLHNLLRATADDPIMRETQDMFFDDVYWQPAARNAANLGITSPLGVTVVTTVPCMVRGKRYVTVPSEKPGA